MLYTDPGLLEYLSGRPIVGLQNVHRIKDWLHGVRQAQPDRDTQKSLTSEPLTEAERFRQVYHMIKGPKEEGGAGIIPKSLEWEYVESIFPLHNHEKNKQWLNEWSRKTLLSPQDLDELRDAVGEKVPSPCNSSLKKSNPLQIAYYYAFLQSYFTFMMFPAAFGFSCWILLGRYSPIYAIVNGLWCIVFVEWWKRQESELAFRWGVRNVSSIEDKRRDFQYEKEVKDPITGETVRYFPATKRLYRQFLQVPFALLASLALGTLIATCFGIEIFLSEVYNGPLKSGLAFLPTILLTTLVPTISTFLTGIATRLTDFENYATQESYDKAMVSKLFVLNFITSYLGICLTAFVYVPFATILVPYLDIFSLTVQPFATDKKQMQTPPPSQFSINPNRLRNQVIYFAVTAQIVNFALETVLPLVKQKGTAKYKEMQASRAEKKGGTQPAISANDPPEEREFLNQAREQAILPEYDVQSDLREMVIQFGYLSLFSVVWPIMPVAFFINNWIELRGDIFKLTMESKRANPQRADSIGPWLESLGFLAWLGSLTSAALVYMFSNNGLGPDGRPSHLKLWGLLLTVFLSEHLYMVVRLGVRTVISKLDSENKRKERAERYMVRKKYLEEAGLGHSLRPGVASPPMSPTVSEGTEQINRRSLEEDARESSLRDSTPSTRFWNRQRGWVETERTGLRYIDLMASTGNGNETKKTM